MASLVVLALWGTTSLGVVGCTAPSSGYGRMQDTPGAFFANVRQSPGEISRMVRNAHYYKLMGQPELGLRELEQAHQQNPDNLQIVNALAQNYEELGKFEAARQLYQEALAKHGPHPVLANNLCFSYYLEGRWQEAETCLRQTLARDPQNVAARNNLGLLYCRLGRQDEARQLWQQAEGGAAADDKVGQALAALGMPDRAVYAQKPAPAPPVAKAISAPSPGAAISRLPAPVSAQDNPPAQPVTRKKSARVLAALPAAGKPAPDDAKPRKEAPKPPAVAEKTPSAAPPAPALPAAPPPRLAPLTCAELVDTAIEIRNGTRSRHLAHQTRTLLSQEGFTVARIGNHWDFGAAKTVIYYRPGAERAARAVRSTFLPVAGLEPSLKLAKGMDIKILLGADLLERPHLMARLAAEK